MGRKNKDLVIPSNQEILKRLDRLEEKLKDNDKENKKTKGLTLIALGFAVATVTFPLIFELYETGDLVKRLIALVYVIVAILIFYKVFSIKLDGD